MENMNIQEKLRLWAEEAYEFYSKEARVLDLDFYTQSDLTQLTDDKPVELMVIGINPGMEDIIRKTVLPNPNICCMEIVISRKRVPLISTSLNGAS